MKIVVCFTTAEEEANGFIPVLLRQNAITEEWLGNHGVPFSIQKASCIYQILILDHYYQYKWNGILFLNWSLLYFKWLTCYIKRSLRI